MAHVVSRIPGCALRTDLMLSDTRGGFTKIRPDRTSDPGREIREVFWSHSRTGVVRGLHVQGPELASHKTVFVTSGQVYDVVLDLRRASPAYGIWESFELRPGMALEVPVGCAHGFQALEDSAMVYLCDQVYNRASDGGVHHASVGIPWPLPVTQVSERDAQLPWFDTYHSPF